MTAADLGSVGRAAIRMHVSQPALSKRLQQLEALAGVRLLDRSPRGVTLTPAGRRLYEHARRLLDQAESVESVLETLQQAHAPVVIAASHSAAEAFVARVLAERHGEGTPIELVTANSMLVRTLVADGRVELGVAPGRPGATPNPAIRTQAIADDEILYAVPQTHRWARRTRIALDEFRREPVVVRDPASNARWTVETELRRRNLVLPPLLVQAPTPTSAKREALARNAPVMLSRGVLRGEPFVALNVGELRFPRTWELVLPALGEPSADVRALISGLQEAAQPVGDGSAQPGHV